MSKIVWPHFQDTPSFTQDDNCYFLNNKWFFIPKHDRPLLAILNSHVGWWQLTGAARIKRGGCIEAEAQYVEQLALPKLAPKAGMNSLLSSHLSAHESPTI
jgi:hypothetical protein